MSARDESVGESLVRIGPGAHVTVTQRGPVLPDHAKQQVDLIFAYADQLGEKLSVVVKLDEAGRPSVEARRTFYEFTKDPRLDRIALVGTHSVARAMAAFFLRWAFRDHVAYFGSEAEARQWLGIDVDGVRFE